MYNVRRSKQCIQDGEDPHCITLLVQDIYPPKCGTICDHTVETFGSE